MRADKLKTSGTIICLQLEDMHLQAGDLHLQAKDINLQPGDRIGPHKGIFRTRQPARNGTKADAMLHAACRNATLRLASGSGNSFSVVCFVIRAEVQDSVPIRNGYFVFTGQPADGTRQFERIQARMSQKFFPRKRIVMQCTPYNTCIFSNRTFIHKLCYQKDPTLQCTMR